MVIVIGPILSVTWCK